MTYSMPTLHHCCQAGRHSDAVHAYRAALDLAASPAGAAHPAPPPSARLYLQLARSYASLRHPDWALQVYTQVLR